MYIIDIAYPSARAILLVACPYMNFRPTLSGANGGSCCPVTVVNGGRVCGCFQKLKTAQSMATYNKFVPRCPQLIQIGEYLYAIYYSALWGKKLASVDSLALAGRIFLTRRHAIFFSAMSLPNLFVNKEFGGASIHMTAEAQEGYRFQTVVECMVFGISLC